MATITETKIKVADEVWVATALLHRENPARSDFMIEEIVSRAQQEAGDSEIRPGVYVHIVQHCVANRPPNPGRYRMLFETSPGRRRLYREGDAYDKAREGAKMIPEEDDLPTKYFDLLRWYHEWIANNIEDRIKNDPLLALYGSGKDIWADEDADTYIRRLREGWE